MPQMIIDTIQEQGSGTINEDHLFIGENTAGVFDGSTSLNGERFRNNKTGGWLAAGIAERVFRENNHDLPDLARMANAEISSAMAYHDVDLTSRVNRWSASAAVVKVEKGTFEWVQIGDCIILVIYRDRSHKILVDGENHDRETLMMWKEISDSCNGTIQEILRDQIRQVRNQTNISYGALNGESTAMDFLKSGWESLSGVHSLLIFTDGLQIPSADPGSERNYDLLVEIFLQSGLAAVRDYVRSQEEQDPTCGIFPRFKPHDDIAAISITL